MKKFVMMILFLAPVCGFSMDVIPSKSVLEVPWNSTEKEAKSVLGEPNGYFNTTKYKKLVFYGKSVVLVFDRGELKGFRYYDTCCQVLHRMSVSINSEYDYETISINGIELSGKTFVEIDEALPQKLGRPDYRAEIPTDEATIRLGFSGMGHSGETDEFHFHSLEVDYHL